MTKVIKDIRQQIAASDALLQKGVGSGILAQILVNELVIMKKLVADYEKQQQDLEDSLW